MSKFVFPLVCIIMGFVGGGLALVAISYWHIPLPVQGQISNQISEGSSLPSAARESVAMEDGVVVETVKETSPGVVSIVITKDIPKLRNSFDSFGFPFFFSPFGNGGQDRSADEPGSTEKQTIGEGSGFLISSDGMIVTNKHVVSETDAEYTVITSDGKEYPAKVLARDPSHDIAVMKIDISDAHALEMGDSDSVKVGQTVVAIGNSLGEFSNTVSKGIISGLGRNLMAGSRSMGDSERLSNILQTDAAINPGNSGGPLLDISGKVIGVNVAIAQGAQNIGFALPINQVKRIVDQVKTTGKISTPFLGVRYIMLDSATQKANSLPLDHGALIVRGNTVTDFAVVPGSPADKAGLVENDIITHINGTAVDENHQIADLVSDRKVGDTITLTVWHKGETKEVKIVLEERK